MIYILLECWCKDEGDFIVGIFSSYKLAEEKLNNLKEKRITRIEEFEIDKLIENPYHRTF